MSKLVFSGSIGRKFAMALSALFLIIFLLQHFSINFTSVFSEKVFNEISHFMGTNPVVQFALQPVLIFGVLFHFIMGFVLEIKNKSAREGNYAVNNGAANSTWMSRNMIWSGLFILFFMGFHFYDFWIPEMNYKYIEFKPEDPNRYYTEVVHMFENPVRVAIYSLSFVFLSLHLLHGFKSAFQSLGARSKSYTPTIQKIGQIYAILIPAGFIFIAIYHYVNNL
ncbi:MAG: succinate dehydrogenase cytochrome b subunit [Ekhidna sp.]|nr:succinate dehydrogenase cytochrome b subunit [Ekhidna sp.]